MKNLKKRLFSMLLIVIMIITLMPTSAFADEVVAKIGETPYTSLQEAVNNAPDGQETVIDIVNNIDGGELTTSDTTTVNTVVTIPESKNIVIDLNGYTIGAQLKTNGNNYYNVHVIRNDGILTIQDSSENQTGTIINTLTTSNACTRTVKNVGTLNITGGRIISDGAVALLNLGECNISGEKTLIESTREGYTGGWDNGVAAIENREAGKLTIYDATVTSASEAGIFCDCKSDGWFKVYSGIITGHSAYGAFNGSTASSYGQACGGQWSSNPSAIVDQKSYAVKLEENNYYSVNKIGEPQEVAVSTGNELLAALNGSSYDKPVDITVNGDVTLESSAELLQGSTLNITAGSTLTVAENVVLTQTGVITNNGTLTVDGFLTNPLNLVNNGVITDLAVTDGKYVINDAMDLQWLTYLVEYDNPWYVTVANDITIPDGVEFQMIGSGDYGFYGEENNHRVFDGQGNTISNLVIRNISQDTGLFQSLKNADVKNVTLDMDVETVTSYTGGVTGYAVEGVSFKNVTVNGRVAVIGASYGCGGFVGAAGSDDENNNAIEFIDCHNNATVGGEYGYNIGGMIGTGSGSKDSLNFYNCSNSGDIITKLYKGYIFGYSALKCEGKIYNFANTTATTDRIAGDNQLTGYDLKVDPEQYYAVMNKDGEWEVVAADIDIAATVDGIPFVSLNDAIGAAKDGDTVYLEADINNDDLNTVQSISINKDIVIDGQGHKISGNVALYVAADNSETAIKNVRFENITNAEQELSSLYANELAGKLTVKDCYFINCDWDAIQITPQAGAEIVIIDNYFETNESAVVANQRFVHIESKKNVDFRATVTGNKMIGETKQEAMGVYYPADLSKVKLNGNYITSSLSVCILDSSGKNIAQLAYPMADENFAVIDTDVALVKDKYYAVAYTSFADAIAAADGKTVCLIKDVNVTTEITVPDNVTLEINGQTITLGAGGKLTTAVDLGDSVVAASGYRLKVSGDAENGYVYTVSRISSGGGSSGSESETVTNPDGSTTTTVTKPDGTVTETTIDTEGNKTEVVKNPDGSSVTTVEKTDGSSSTTNVSKDGEVKTEVDLPKEVVDNAAENNEAIALPMSEVDVVEDSENADVITVNLPEDTTAKVEIPVKDVTINTVAVIVNEDGSEKVIKASLMTENGIAVTLSDGDTVKIIDNGKEFTDIKDGYWGAEAVDFATSRELFAGTSTTTFSPEEDMTRAMVVTVLARYNGVDTSGGDPWYEKGQQWAQENGVSDGNNMQDSISREQLASMLYRYVGSPAVSGKLTGFSDVENVSSWAENAMIWAVDAGLIKGMGDGTLNPQGTATRAQVAAILMRFIEFTN